MNTFLWRFGAGASLFLGAVLQFLPSLAIAQEGELSGKTTRVIEEVLVSARRSTENLQDVPVAVSAISGDALQRENITTARDLQGRVPSLVVGTGSLFRNTMTPTIRGQGASFNASPGVAQYFADVPLPADSFTIGQGGPGMLFDLSSIQILKGPQGTLFGRNTTGGAMVLQPAMPGEQFEARLMAEAGNYDSAVYEGVVNIPIVSDRLMVRLGYHAREREGYTYDVASGKDYDNINYWTARLGVTFRVGDSVENTIIAYTSERDENGPGTIIGAINKEGINETVMRGFLGLDPLPLVPAELQAGCLYVNVFSGRADCGQGVVDAQKARDIRHTEHGANTSDWLETWSVINTLTWHVSDDLTFKSISSMTRYQRRFGWDQDGSPLAFNDVNPTKAYSSDTESYTQELQLQGKLLDASMDYVAGLYFEHKEPNSVQRTDSVSLFQATRQTYGVETTSYGPYAQINYDLGHAFPSLENMTLTAGARHTTDDQEGEALLVFLGSGTPFSGSQKESAITWNVGLDYRFTDDVMAYGKISKGYKSGSFSPTTANPNNFSFKPEYVTSYEVGTKSEFLLGNIPFRANGSVYHTDYKDMHKSVVETYNDPNQPVGIPAIGATTFNVGESWIRGVELEITARPSENLTLLASYTYTDAEYEDFKIAVSSVSALLDCTGNRINGGEIGDFSCVPFSEILKDQYSLTANYSLPMPAAAGFMEMSLTYAYFGERYTGTITLPEDEPGALLEGAGLWNGSIAWHDIFNTPFSLQVFGTNLTDEEYRVSNSNVWKQLSFQASLWSEPRMYGARLTYRLGE